MKLVIKGRGDGKTTRLIYTSEVTGYPIATMTRSAIEHIKTMAEEMGCDIPDPVTYDDLANGRQRGIKQYENILADDVNYILQKALNAYLHSNVRGATFTY